MGWMDKAKQMLSGHQDKVDTAVEKGGDAVDQRTGGKYVSQVDMGQDKARDMLAGGEPAAGEPAPGTGTAGPVEERPQ